MKKARSGVRILPKVPFLIQWRLMIRLVLRAGSSSPNLDRLEDCGCPVAQRNTSQTAARCHAKVERTLNFLSDRIDASLIWPRAALALLLLAALLPLAAAAETVAVQMRREDCARLTVPGPMHKPAPDVAYRPGLDVHGQAVAPADLPGSAPLDLADGLPVYLDVPIDLPDRRRAYGAEAGLGIVELWREGGRWRAYLNGWPLGGDAEAALQAACAAALER